MAHANININNFDSINEFMAKDNVLFHSIIFPTMCLGSNTNLLPTKIFATEYLNYENSKFSKTNNTGIFGNHVIEINKLLDINEDYWRFYLILIRPENSDSIFTLDGFVNSVNNILCSKVGNYVNRLVTLTHKYFPNTLLEYKNDKLDCDIKDIYTEYCNGFDKLSLRGPLLSALKLADYGNEYLQSTAPWKLIKTDISKTKEILSNGIHILYLICNMFKVFMPITFDNISNVIICNNNSYKICIDTYKMPFKNLDRKDLDKVLASIGIKN